jgi:putative membrane protein
VQELTQSLMGIGGFALYFGVSLVLLIAFKFIYTLATPHDEFALIKEQNTSAAIALSGAIIGFCIALSGAATNSVSIVDFVVWSVVALVAQLTAILVVRIFMPLIVKRIKDGEVPAGIVLGAVSVGVGLLNAACMTY